ncbi:MAG: DUF2961 domain-containing protein [Pirellulales bacterium]|nr:DUF2961 domain-containing protein [Pirellulales bacterium]
MHARLCFLPFVLVVLSVGVVPAATVSLDSLLDEMTDRAGLASLPQPAYTCVQASSYDRQSKAPDKPNWFANGDNSSFVRGEKNNGREEWVMMDAKGPGAIVRWWITAPDEAYKGKIRIYIDGASEPIIEARADELVGGTTLVGPPLSSPRSRGRNIYLPISYAKQCKVTFDRPNHKLTGKAEDLLYYQINYRTYTPGTEVKSFSLKQLAAAKQKIAKLQETLLKPDSVMPADVYTMGVPELTIPAGEELVRTLDGPAAICRLTGRLEAEDLTQALRSTVLVMEFDGEQTVWCPLSDFFGSGVGLNAFTGWYRKVEKDGQMTCWWVMPYKESCTIRVKNLGKQSVKAMDLAIDTCPWKWDDHSLHFHTTWHQERNIPTEDGGRAARDWNYITVKGQGVFVGDTLAVFNRDPAWWGEGDEKIYIDGEKFPSHFGTGTEDYYGYAWCTPVFFESPFHAQPRAEGPSNYGHTTNTRVRLLDAIPFNKSFHFDMEVWHWRKTEIDYAATSYWYGRPGAKANHGPDSTEALQPVEYKSPRPVPKVPGFNIIDVSEGSVMRQIMVPFGRGKWEKDDHLWWTQAKPGGKLNLAVTAEKNGKYELTLKMTKAPDYAIVQLSLDGKKLGGPIDLYDPKVVPTGPVNLGTMDLSKGKHTLTVEIVGANPEAKKSYMFGLDCITLKPSPRR